MLECIRVIAAFAVNPQSVFAGMIFAKLTFFFPSLAFCTAFVLYAIKRLMCFFTLVVFLCHSLSILLSQPPLLTRLVGSFI
jgi:hypothetical protein